MHKLLLAIVAGLLLAGNAQATGLDLSFSNETANLEYLAPVRKFSRGDRGGQLQSNGLFSLGFFYNELCLLYTSPSPRDRTRSRMPSSA